VSLPRLAIPSQQEVFEAFSKILTVTLDKNTGYVTVAIDHYSPAIAKRWVDWLVEDLNTTIQRQEIAEASRAIDYLSQQIELTSLAELRAVFFRLIEEQTKKRMLANVTPEYVFRSLDPAVVPERHARPHRFLIAIVGLLLGSMFGSFACLLVIKPNRTK
jgi:uncharacterized protein involved in exopolysaccharide biosynthesis